ncbi:MAG: AAA family ATPase [Lewinellaceae bacterium]|nr:AAA family ATPase [Phaeodactylibacter sp.]MCB9035865.1 AAA family ATPase [Lewinellaceae bacterium]
MNKTTFGRQHFILTKEHLRFEEFADACEQYRYIGLCYGKPGVGKSFSAWHYARWEVFKHYKLIDELDEKLEEGIKNCKAIYYSAPVANTPKRIAEYFDLHLLKFGNALAKVEGKANPTGLLREARYQCPLVIVDESDCLSYKSLEQLRHLYDEYGFGLILIGMPGFEKRLARYPQLYSRVGFAHEFRPLSADEMEFIFERNWQNLGLELDRNQFSDVEALKTIARVTNGNFRLIHRIFTQINRIQQINKFQRITQEVVLAARNCLVIGQA